MISTRRAVVFTFLGTSVFWVGVIVLLAVFMGTGAPPFQVDVDVPDTSYVNKEITVTVTIGNPSDKAQELESIDVYNTFLEGFTVKSIEPVPEEISGVLNFKSYYFNHPLQPKETFTIAYHLVPIKAGHFGGDLDICLPSQKLTTTYVGTLVMPQGENEKAAAVKVK